MDNVNRVELPCSKCGNAAVSIVLFGLLDALGSKLKLAMKGAARLAGSTIDEKHPTLGMAPAEISSALALVCLVCVDEGRADG